MNEILVKYGWECYKKGCSCQGLPKYYKHDKHENYICITKSGYGIIKRGGIEIFKTKNLEDYENEILKI